MSVAPTVIAWKVNQNQVWQLKRNKTTPFLELRKKTGNVKARKYSKRFLSNLGIQQIN